jgi:glycerol-3-phosphate acyltransferase PlsY
MDAILFALLSYLYGSIPFGYIATYIIKGKRLTEEGTGNVGVTNTFKVGGTGAGIITILGEISKAIVPIVTAKTLFPGSQLITFLFVFCALVGTSFSAFLKGKGGKGSTAAFWSIFLLSRNACFILLGTWIILALLARSSVHIKKLQLICIPCVIYLVERNLAFTLFGVLTSVLFFITTYWRKDDFSYYNILSQKRSSAPVP